MVAKSPPESATGHEQRARRLFFLACAGIVSGLAVAGTFDSATGGVIVVTAWVVCVAALHRLGRLGSSRA
jgi:hypothetical protein